MAGALDGAAWPVRHFDPKPWAAPYEPAGSGEETASGGRALPLPPGMTGMVFAGPRNTAIVHPDDGPGLREARERDEHGGAAARWARGDALWRSCGTLVATLVADCMGPYELHLDPVRVYAFDA
ncbi:hypothetical protein [Streptomyces sp. NPDC088261]|uniref:hypothetical protein n=1 Tax=Streptomyces sp. NPDC088261 TaxID=3365851 RepID=UPI0037F35E87